MLDGSSSPDGPKNLLWITLGRQRVGKTTLLNTAIQYFRGLGCPIEVWNADQQNRSYSLSTFFEDALSSPQGGLEDAKAWIEERIVDQVARRYDPAPDAGGGMTGFTQLLREVPVVGALEEQRIRVVGLFCIGPERADLDYLEQFAGRDSFLPAATVIVLNGGLVLTGRSAQGAFAPVLRHASVKAAVARGARIVPMPALTCMSQVTDRELTFADAAAGAGRPDQEPLSFFDRARVNRWWTIEIPAFFAKFPLDWVPWLGARPTAESRRHEGRERGGFADEP